MFEEAFENAIEADGIVALQPILALLSRRYTVTEMAFGRINNRLQACVNLLHLLGTEGGALSEQARLLVTQLQSEIALLRSLVRQSLEPMQVSCTCGVAP